MNQLTHFHCHLFPCVLSLLQCYRGKGFVRFSELLFCTLIELFCTLIKLWLGLAIIYSKFYCGGIGSEIGTHCI